MKIRSSCEIEDVVDARICKLRTVCDTPIERTYWMRVLVKDIGRRLPSALSCTRVNTVTLVNLCRETKTPVCEGDKF